MVINGFNQGSEKLLKQLFIKSARQKEWIEKLTKHEESFQRLSKESDEKGRFPKKNIQTLVDLGYTKLPLPKEYGGEGSTITDLVLFQETISSFDGATGLSIGWHQSVIGELYEKKLWRNDILTGFAKEITNGALVNRAASEAQTGSPTRGGRPQTNAVKKNGKWVITGRKSLRPCPLPSPIFLSRHG